MHTLPEVIQSLPGQTVQGSHDLIFVSKQVFFLQGLKRHMESVHEKLDKYRCNSCPKSFTLPYSLKRHVAAVHAGGDTKQYRCDVCSKTFSLRDALKRHRERVHKLKGLPPEEKNAAGPSEDLYPVRRNQSMALAPPPVRLATPIPHQQHSHAQQLQFQQLHPQQLSIPTAYVRPPPPGGFAFNQSTHQFVPKAEPGHHSSGSRKGSSSSSSSASTSSATAAHHAHQALTQATALLSHIRQPVWPT